MEKGRKREIKEKREKKEKGKGREGKEWKKGKKELTPAEDGEGLLWNIRIKNVSVVEQF